MKKFTLISAVLWAACAFIFAGPEPYKSQIPEIVPSCAQFGGFYFGADVGGVLESRTWNDRDDWVDNFAFDFSATGGSKDRTGVTAGGLIGYNWQKNCALLGFEIDGSWTSIDGHTHLSPADDPANPASTVLRLNDSLNWWGSARTRTGVVVDNLLLYITGGVAFADLEHRWTITDDFVPTKEAFSADDFRWGGVAGAGGEWAINRRWSFRTEFLYVHFVEEHTSGFSPAGNQNVHFDTQDSMIVSRAAIVYRFGGGH